MSVVDKLTAIDIKAATSAGEIATGLSQFASLAGLNGINIDQASAMVATIADVSQQSGSSVGQALKTIISRYGAVKAGAFNELSTDYDSSDAEGNLNDVEKVLGKIGIAVRDTNLQFRDFDDILEDLSEKWITLDNVSKNAIATAFAGTRQRNSFLNLLDNMDKYHELLKTSEESAGTAQRKYEAYQESIEAWTKKLQAAWEELANNADIAAFLKSILKVSTGLVKALPQIIRYGSTLFAMLNTYKIPGLLKMAGSFFGLTGGSGGSKGVKARLLGGNFYDKQTEKLRTSFGIHVESLDKNVQGIYQKVTSEKTSEGVNNTLAPKGEGEPEEESKVSGKNIGVKALAGVGAGVMAGLSAPKTIQKDGETYEMSTDTKILSGLVTGLGTGLATYFGGPLAGMIAQAFLNGLIPLVAQIIPSENEKIERLQAIKRNEKILEKMDEIKSSLDSIADSVKVTNEWTGEDFKKWNDAVNEIVESVSSDKDTEKDFREQFVKYLNKNGLEVEDTGSLKSIIDNLSSDSQNISKIYNALTAAQSLINFNGAQDKFSLDERTKLSEYKENLNGKGQGHLLAARFVKQFVGGDSLESVLDHLNGALNHFDTLFSTWILDDNTAHVFTNKEYTKELLEEIISGLEFDIKKKEDDYSKVVEEGYSTAIDSIQDKNNIWLKDASQDYLYSMYSRNGLKEVINDYMVNTLGIERDSLNDELFTKAIRQNDNLREFWTGNSFTLNKAIIKKDEELLQDFASALKTPTDSLKEGSDIVEYWKDFTLGELNAGTTALTENLNKLGEGISSLSKIFTDAFKFQEYIVKNYPELIEYLGDSQQLASKFIDKYTKTIELYNESSFEDVLGNPKFFGEHRDKLIEEIQTASGLDDTSFENQIMQRTNLMGISTWKQFIGWINSWNGLVLDDDGTELDLSNIKKSTIDTLEKLDLISDKWNELMDLTLDYLSKDLDHQISNLNAQKDQIQKVNKEREYENKLIKARIDLENAQREKKRVWREGLGFVYEADQGNILEKQKALEDIENEKIISKLDVQITELQSIKDSLTKWKEDADYEGLKAVVEETKKVIGADSSSSILGILENIKEHYNKSIDQDTGEKFTEGENYGAVESNISRALSITRDWNQNETNRSQAANTIRDIYNDKNISEETRGKLQEHFGEDILFNSIINSPADWNESNTARWDLSRFGIFSKPIVIDGQPYIIGDSLSDDYKDYLINDTSLGEGFFYEGVVPGDEIPSSGWTQLPAWKKWEAEQIFKEGSFPNNWIGKETLLKAANGEIEYIYKDKNGKFYNLKPIEYSIGSLSSAGGLSLLNEFGTEAIVTPQGTLTALPSKTGIVPSDITTNLWRLGEMTPDILRGLNSAKALDNLRNNSAVNDESFHVENLTMNVAADGSFDADAFVRSIRERVSLTKNKR